LVNKWCTLNYTVYEIHYWSSLMSGKLLRTGWLLLFVYICWRTDRWCAIVAQVLSFTYFRNGMLDKIVLLFCSPFCFLVMNISWNIPFIQNPCSASSVLRVRASFHTRNFHEELHIDRKICMWCCGWRFVMKSEGAGSWSQRALCTLSCLSYLPTSYVQP
jgi:hypothetical protein